MGDGALMHKLLTWQVICRGAWYIVRGVCVLPYLFDKFSKRILINISLFKQRKLKKTNEVRSWPQAGKRSWPRLPGQPTRVLLGRDSRSTGCSSQETEPQPGCKGPRRVQPLLRCPSSRSNLTAAAATFQGSGAGLPGPTSLSSQQKLEEGKCKGTWWKELMLPPLF